MSAEKEMSAHHKAEVEPCSVSEEYWWQWQRNEDKEQRNMFWMHPQRHQGKSNSNAQANSLEVL